MQRYGRAYNRQMMMIEVIRNLLLHFSYVTNHVFIALANGSVAVFRRVPGNLEVPTSIFRWLEIEAIFIAIFILILLDFNN